MRKLSHTSVSRFLQCGKQYDLYYNQKIRLRKQRSALSFGKCVDEGLNALLEGKGLPEALQLFRDAFRYQWINGEVVDTSQSDLVKYSKSDSLEGYNDGYDSLLMKGNLMISTYAIEVLPKIKKVIAIQKPVNIKNQDDDEIAGFLDLIVEWEDGKIYLMDNKTSSVQYEENAAKESSQLNLYYFMEKDNYKLDGVGFIILDKNIKVIRHHRCKTCGNLVTNTRKKTCDAIVNDKRCGGEWELVNLEYKVNIDYQFAVPEEKIFEKVIEDFDTANNGIHQGEFQANYKSCRNKFGLCDYYDLCHNGDDSKLVHVKSEKR